MSFKLLKRAQGSYLLEFSLVVPIILVFALGTVDLSRYLQIRNALMAATESAVRCVYPTDGACVISDAPGPKKLFDWYKTTAPVEYIVDTYNYGASVNSYYLNRLEYRPVAEVLDTMTYQPVVSGTIYEPQINGSNWKGVLPYWERVEPFPTVVPESASSASARNVGISGGQLHLETNPNASISTASHSPVLVARETFSISAPTISPAQSAELSAAGITNFNPYDYKDCYELDPSQPSQPIFMNPQKCHHRWPWPVPFGDSPTGQSEIANGTYIALRITADGSTSSSSVIGAATITIDRWNSTSNQWVMVHDLSGQEFNCNGACNNLNFWVRGLPGPNEVGFPSHTVDGDPVHPGINIRYGQLYRVNVRAYVKQGTGNISFSVNKIQVFGPKYRLRTDRYVDCPGVPTGESANQQNCPHNPPLIKFSEISLASQNIDPFCAENDSAALDTVSALGITGVPVSSTGVPCQATVGGAVPITVTCPAPGQLGNFGYSSLTVAQKVSICGGAHSLPVGSISFPTFTTKSVVLDPQIRDEYCFGTSVLVDLAQTPLGGYLDYNWGDPVIQSQLPVYPVSLENGVDLGSFSCARLRIHYFGEDILTNGGTFEGAEFSLGPFSANSPNLGCTRDSVLEQYIRSILRYPEPHLLSYSISENLSGHASFPNIPTTCGVPFSTMITSGGVTEYLGQFDEGTIPSDCIGTGIQCHTTFVGFSGGTPPLGPKLDLTLAATKYGAATFKALIPSTRENCTDNNCLTLTVDEQGDFVKANASFKMPLLLFGNNTIPLTASSEERLERTFGTN